MKGAIVSVFAFAGVLLSSAVASARTPDRPQCTAAILNGSYGLLHDGVVFGEAGHLAEVAVARFDGKGHWTLDATLVRQDSGLGHPIARDATYTVNPDCTGSAELHGSETFTFDFVVLNGGQELLQIATRPDQVVTWEVRKQNLPTCTNATLNGSYGFRLNGTIFARGLLAGVGVITFDGKGQLSLRGTVVFQDTGLSHPDFTGSYTVNPDCTGSSNDLGGGGGTFAFVIVDGGNRILQIATRPDRAVTYVLEKQFPRRAVTKNAQNARTRK